ncbi:MAG: protein translocase subunit SecD [Deltaproteobacteria bacterium]|jgi:preprotein translocase subunit SecD|nr:protein translocase subunit SecD [Deltaproteobacteria bacterium]MBT4641845.1 protein translocase subunit SecD [Deltaproteobacteria bacterium]MBT6504586.1 protein translocase subunit SecD [Deltaproteobacteria bacterium]MBT6611255.1 protein translocase subunit SecD [Deltaproteobacteria bacterium]MBT7151203.1 protein translocase subunit SecD [Deltaproteobacteria bacterium]
MKIPWKGLGILAVLLVAIVMNIPTVLTYMPVEESATQKKMEVQLQRMQETIAPLKKIQLALVELKQKRIQLLAEEGLEFTENHSVLKTILKDNFSIEKGTEGIFLKLKDSASEDVYISDVADQLNGLFTNVRKIKDIRLHNKQAAIVFEVEKGKRLSHLAEPLKTFLGDDFEISYRPEQSLYVTREKTRENVINLGLDLQGGMRQDVGVKVDEVVISILDRLAEELEDNLINDNINYESVTRISDSEIELLLEPDESFALDEEVYKRLLDRNYEITSRDSGYLITMNEDEIERIKKRAIQQALETIRNRIDQLGVKEPTVQLRRGDESIIIQLPGLTDPDQARRVIGTVAVLNFQLVANQGSVENPGKDQIVLYEEIRDPVTKEVLSTRPYLLEKKIQLPGDRVRDSRVGFLPTTGAAYVSLSLDDKGKDEFAEVTRNNVGRLLAIVLDGKVQSAPRLNEEISGGEAQISGSFTPEEATELALVLRSGALPAPIVINEERTVGPSLGLDSILKSMWALALGFVGVMIFMIVYYNVAGVFSVIALIFNLLLIAAALAYFQATLTLPGMAGIVLTIGMAVDANVLIFERIREEIARKSPIRTAVNTGFQKATITILDSNITTLLAAIVLFQFGTGAIKGFAVTLMIGIAASMFTSIIVGRMLFEIIYLRKARLEKISI